MDVSCVLFYSVFIFNLPSAFICSSPILLTLLIVSRLQDVASESDNQTITTKIEEEELVQSESKDGKLEIIKRIKKINPDGSYTIGYEADDGSFKIESRDVLGNVKGTYGFVDDEGEIKRVSYSSSNASDIFAKHEPVTVPEFPSRSVVQRIPKNEKSSTTHPTTSTPTSTPISAIQSVTRRRVSSTTVKPNYNSIDTTRASTKQNSVTYSSAAPRVLLQRPSLATNREIVSAKSEGQISRPEVSDKPTEFPIFRSSATTKYEENEKPVTEEASEISTNILRRQLPQDTREPTFSPQEHVYNLQQSLGHNDISDIYNNGVAVTSRPLFTTTRSNRVAPIISSTTATPVVVAKPTTPKYVAPYQRNQLQEVDSNTATYTDISTTAEPASTSTNLPVVQIPANRPAEPLVAIRHPFQQGAILVPLSQLQNGIIPVENMQEIYDARRRFVSYQEPTRSPAVEVERQTVRRLNPPTLRPLPVQVDENGFIREMPRPIPTPRPVNNDIENIQPPVSTKDFQTLLNQLIVRQKRLERISALTNPKLHPEFYRPPAARYQRIIPAPQQYYIQRVYSQQKHESDDGTEQRGSMRQYVAVRPQEDQSGTKYSYQYYQREEENDQPKQIADTYAQQQNYLTNRRTRLVPFRDPIKPVYAQDETEEYLPPDVREMLLLRMLQLAMNPALPLDNEEESQQLATVTAPQYRAAPTRNVEILGEEPEEEEEVRKRRPAARVKRYREEDMEYME